MKVHNSEDVRGDTMGETTVTVSWWKVITLIGIIFGFFFVAILNHESRLSRTEEAIKSISKIEQLVSDIRKDQIRRYELERIK